MKNKELTFPDNKGYLVVIMSDVFKKLQSYRQINSNSPESAGVLIGERRGSHLIICDLSEPGSDDIQHRYRVNRKGKHHQEKVNEAFAQSNGIRQYIGEWHTHPEDNPSPSFIDKQSWKNNIYSFNPMILIIVGRKKIWAGKKDGYCIIKLNALIE